MSRPPRRYPGGPWRSCGCPRPARPGPDPASGRGRRLQVRRVSPDGDHDVDRAGRVRLRLDLYPERLLEIGDRRGELFLGTVVDRDDRVRRYRALRPAARRGRGEAAVLEIRG